MHPMSDEAPVLESGTYIHYKPEDSALDKYFFSVDPDGKLHLIFTGEHIEDSDFDEVFD